ncbi:LacI family transcriptional regulator, partial [Leucothrix pacifica]
MTNQIRRFLANSLDTTFNHNSIAEHLVELEHRHFGVISGILRGNDRAQQRLEGIKQHLQQNGIGLDDGEVLECRYSGEQGRLAMHELMTHHPQTTAVICGNDILALG